MGLRERRLQADAREMARFRRPDGPVRIVEMEGEPPERYLLEFAVPSLVVQNREVRRSDRHLVDIFLTLAYPRQAPQCRMLTPVFHPNIAPHAICAGDHWTPGESLPGLVVRIAEMLAYQNYNVKSPLNGDAARWVEANRGAVPLTREDFWTLLKEGQEE
jgi:hypothetical protein